MQRSVYLEMAKRIPSQTRKIIIQQGYLDKVFQMANTNAPNTPLHYLFEVYNNFVNTKGQHDDFNCPRCRAHVLDEWRKMKPHIIELNALQNVSSNANN